MHELIDCMDLDCGTCFPPYTPRVGDIVKDSLNQWTVYFVGQRNGHRDMMQLKHWEGGHYADVPLTNGTIEYGTYTKLN